MTAPALLGVGLSLPGDPVAREQAARLLTALCPPPEDRQRAWRALLRRSGVETRHAVVADLIDDGGSPLTTTQRMALFAEHAPPLGERAALEALNAAGVTPGDVTHLLAVSCTGLSAPGLGATLARRLDLRPTVERLDVSFMGCHGVLVALRQAADVVRARPDARVLVTAVELCSLHLQQTFRLEEAVAQALFADGAGACVVAAADDDAHPPWRLGGAGTLLLEEGADLLGWDVGESGFRIVLSPGLPDVVGRHLRDWLGAWLDAQGLALADVGSWAVHPGGPRILTAVEQALALPPHALDASRDVLARCGNMSSPSVLFVLEALRDEPRPCVALGLGPGPSFEALLLD